MLTVKVFSLIILHLKITLFDGFITVNGSDHTFWSGTYYIFVTNCKNMPTGTQIPWNTLKDYIFRRLHHRRRLGSHTFRSGTYYFFSMNCKNYQNGTQLLWHTLKNYIIRRLHHRRRLGLHILIQYILSFYLLLS